MPGRSIAIAAILSLLVGACQRTVVPSQADVVTAPSSVASAASVRPSPPPSPVAGGCGATRVFAGPGPDADLGLVDNAWASATPADAGIVAYFWYPPPDLVFAHGPSGGTKVLWISHRQQATRLTISAHPVNASSPVVQFAFAAAESPIGNYPSSIDLPSAGCWRLELTLGTAHATIDVLVAPARSALRAHVAG